MWKRFLNKLRAQTYPQVDRFFYKAWYQQPFTSQPMADQKTYLKLARETEQDVSELMQKYVQSLGYQLRQDWLSELALHTQIVIKKSKLCYQHGPLLYASLRSYIARTGACFVNIVETGTARGFSSICMARALEDSHVEGKIVTFDVLPHQTSMYWNCIDDCTGPKTRQQLLGAYRSLLDRYVVFVQGDTRVSLPKVQLSRVHFAFLDGAHSYADVMQEFAYLKDKQKEGDIVVYDDYNAELFPGVVRAVDEICAREGYEKLILDSKDGRAYVLATKIGQSRN